MKIKKFLSMLLSVVMVFFAGCTPNTDLQTSSGSEYVYEEGTDAVESVISQIEEEISDLQQSSNVTVIVEEEVYYTDNYDDSSKTKPGKQNTIIESGITSENAQEIEPADINTKGEKPLYYSYLTESQQKIYQYMKTAAENMTEGLFSIGAVKNGEPRLSDINIAYRAMTADNPQIFWLPSTYKITPDGSAMAFSYGGVTYPLTLEEKRLAETRVNSAVKGLAAQANMLSSRYEKELFFHDWLCENVVYKDDGTDDIYSVYGALVNGVAVCEGYSRAMQLLCDSVGVPCTIIYGSAKGQGHMWNVVNPGDGWYHLDITWDDDQEYNYVRHAFFNLTDSEIKKVHEIFDIAQPDKYYVGTDDFNLHLFGCNSESYNYFNKSKLIFTQDYSANAKIIDDVAKQGKTSIEVGYDGEDYVSFLNQVNISLFQMESDVWLIGYSNLGDSLVLWW